MKINFCINCIIAVASHKRVNLTMNCNFCQNYFFSVKFLCYTVHSYEIVNIQMILIVNIYDFKHNELHF